MTDPRLGTLVHERFRLVELLSDGLTGTVYRAVQEPLGRQVAVKLLAVGQEFGDPEVRRQRFLQEAELLATLSHDALVTLFDYGTDESGIPYMVHELFEGRPLQNEIDDGPPAASRACEIMALALEGVQAAHAKGVVHRDLKPNNIVVANGGSDSPSVKVLDFGIAKAMQGDDTTVEAMTAAGMLLGTFRYMSPEQTRAEPVTPASDVYAAGVILYELVVGKHPYETDDLAIMISDHRDRPPPEAPGVPEAIAAVWRRAMAKAPTERFPNAGEMAAALRAAMEQTPAACVGDDFGGTLVPADPKASSAATPPLAEELGTTVMLSAPAAKPKSAHAPATEQAETVALTPAELAEMEARMGSMAEGSATEASEAENPKPAAPESDQVPAPAPPVSEPVPPPPAPSLTGMVAREEFQATAGLSPEQLGELERGDREVRSQDRGRMMAIVAAVVALLIVAGGAWRLIGRDSPLLFELPERSTPPGMVRVGGGEYPIGCPPEGERCFEDESPGRNVTLEAFAVMKFEVTVEQYGKCVSDSGCPPPDQRCSDRMAVSPQSPRNCVSLAAAQAFCTSHGWRLPLEDEWEAAARGPKGASYPWGEDPPTCGRTLMRARKGAFCGSDELPGIQTSAGDKSWAEVHGLGGGLREWTGSLYAAYPGGTALTEGLGKQSARGGSGLMSDSMFPTSRTRGYATGQTVARDLGFRCAMAL